jgi:hypothetical protein
MNMPLEPQEPPRKAPSLTELATDYDDHSKAIKALAEAQEEIGQLRDARREERVGWFVISVILFDCAMLLNAENSVGPLIIGVLQIAVLAIAAKRMGVEEFYALFSAIMHRFGDMVMGKSD